MNRRQITRFLLAGAIALAGTACSGEAVKRFGYTMGAQSACRSANAEHVYESAEDLRCTTLQTHEGQSYDDYVTARKQALNDN